MILCGVFIMSSSALSPQVLDELALAAYAAVVSDGVDRSQVNKLIEVLESTRNTDYLLAYIARQVGRGMWGRSYHSASKLYELLKGKSVEEARTILGLFKWLYEAGSNKLRQLRQLRASFRGQAPRGFFYTYLSATLSP